MRVTVLIHPTVLHPQYKLQYFQDAGWPGIWIQNARRMLLNEYNCKYKPQTAAANDLKEAVGNKVPEVCTVL